MYDGVTLLMFVVVVLQERFPYTMVLFLVKKLTIPASFLTRQVELGNEGDWEGEVAAAAAAGGVNCDREGGLLITRLSGE